MKKLLRFIKAKIVLIVIFLSFNMFGQCPPDGFLYLITQEDVDNFIIDYPSCTELQSLLIGDLIPSTISNLDGLINLERVDWLQLTNVPITNLQGLNNIQSIGRFVVYYVPDLLSFEGLDSLETVDGQEFRIELCNSITSFAGLENLNSFDGDYFTIDENNNLNDSNGLNCYFFSEDFRNSVINYTVQSSLNQSIFDNCGISLSLGEFNQNNIYLYPNPTKNHLNINNSEHIKEIRIYDLTGRLVKSKISNFKIVDLSSISSGEYILQIDLDSKIVLNKKLIIE